MIIIIASVVLKTTAIRGVSREWDKYEMNLGKCPLAPAAYESLKCQYNELVEEKLFYTELR